MMIMHLLIFLVSCITVSTRYSLYHTDPRQASYTTSDCLYAYLIDGGKESGSRYTRNYHLIPYCRRPDDAEEEEQVLPELNGNIAQTITFQELKKQGVTTEQLLTWLAPIDIAERYEMKSNSSDVFHNCSSTWFGSECQYKFGYDSPLSFGDIVETTFSNYSSVIHNVTEGTCYRFLDSCNHDVWPLCLDWREICDGKMDCLNGDDEQWCGQLEMTQCADDEYRCHYGGQCIPLSFDKDSRLSMDCLDGSDEIDIYMNNIGLINSDCTDVSTFRCHERIGRYPWSFQCGDGQYLYRFEIPNRMNMCTNKRDREATRTILTSLDHIPDMNCRQAFYCALHHNRTNGKSKNLYFTHPVRSFTNDLDQSQMVDTAKSSPIVEDVWDKDCEPLSQYCLSEWVVIPSHPIMFGFFQFAFFTNRSVSEFKENVAPDFVCFDAQKCPALLTNRVSIEIISGLTCCHISNLTDIGQIMFFEDLMSVFSPMRDICLGTGTEQSCKNSSYFHCNQSLKCIPSHRVADGIADCLYQEDESSDVCQSNDSNRFICASNPNICLSSVAVGNGLFDCPDREDETYIYSRDVVQLAPFSALCSNEGNLPSLSGSETEKTNCEWWSCNNPYSQCDEFSDCPNGADELNCPNRKCSLNEHECRNDETSYCSSVAHIFDKYLDNCSDPLPAARQIYFYNGTNNLGEDYFSWNNSECITSDEICRIDLDSQISVAQKQVCLHHSSQPNWMSMKPVHRFENNEYLCDLTFRRTHHVYDSRFLKVTRFGFYPSTSTNLSISKRDEEKKVMPPIDGSFVSYCHRGIAVFRGINQTKTCFCPPNFFGARCQWQSQRISLTLQFLWRSTASSTVIFLVIVMLIDEHGQMASNHEQITYMPTRDCNTKFNIYLLYPHRPKHLSSHYSIRIDLFEKRMLVYWGSWYLSIPFQFLPVNRIVSRLHIPEERDTEICSLSCGEHGRCTRYTNQKSLFFCRCDEGYSGDRCDIKHTCNCAQDSFCLSSSICICPLYKYGSHCYLKHPICRSSNNPCQHHGLCLPIDDRIDLRGFTCFCPEDYSGERCENTNNRIDIHLDKITRAITSLVFIHFIAAFNDAEHQRTTVLKKIPFDHHTITLRVAQPFNILFVQIPNQHYYLIVLREIFIPSEYIQTKLLQKQRCSSIAQLVNKTFMDYEYFRRTKYYPIVCRQHLQLMCFHDNDLMCICDLDRFSNCFLFNRSMNNYCQGFNNCENGGQCFQNNETCPTKSTCVCQDCFYGAKCQFSTKGFIFSLDPILGYHIKPNVSINRQPMIIRISIAISTVIFVAGLISGFLSIVTFRRKKPRKVGSGYYLLVSSLTSVCMIIFLTFKFWQLILSQMLLITNRSLLVFNCIAIDFILKILLASSEWLNACVAVERMISVIKETKFSRKNSRYCAKWVILCVFILTIFTHIHDPIHRQLIEDFDGDEQRTWCFVRYSSSVGTYNSFITLFHFLFPFSINLLTALRIIKGIADRRSNTQPEHSFEHHLQRQVRRHRHLLFAPCMLIILSLPRLVISFTSGCMRTVREPWLHLISYYISFIPSMLTFAVFVLPSKSYKKEFHIMYEQTIKRFRTKL